MRYFTTLGLDNEEFVYFEIEAANATEAIVIASAYLKGRFEGSGKGGDVITLSTAATRGRTYRRL